MDTEYRDLSQIVIESACSLLKDPVVLSEYFIAEALERRQKGIINIKDAKELSGEYLAVLCESRAEDYETAPRSLIGP